MYTNQLVTFEYQNVSRIAMHIQNDGFNGIATSITHENNRTGVAKFIGYLAFKIFPKRSTFINFLAPLKSL